MTTTKSLLRTFKRCMSNPKLAKLYVKRFLFLSVAFVILTIATKYIVVFGNDTVGNLWNRGWDYLLRRYPILLLFMGGYCIYFSLSSDQWKGKSKLVHFIYRPFAFLLGIMMIMLWTRMA